MVSGLRITGLAVWPLFLLLGLFHVVRADPPTKPEDQHSIVGTWSSGSQQVLTGRNGNTMFYNPIMKQFTVPAAAGISYSFTNDGHFEMAKLAYSSNAEKPDCFEAQLIWQHGTYVSNTSTITMNPYKGDGAVQTVSPCNPEATRVQMSVYSETEFISNWTTYIETQPAFLGNEDDTVYSMQMYAFDGQPYAKLYLVYDPPNMLPQEQLFMNVVGASS